MDIMMKILLPAGFVTLKLTGTFIDFMLGLSNSNSREETSIKTAKVLDSTRIWLILYEPNGISWRTKNESFETVVKELFNLYENTTSVDSTVSKSTDKLKKMLGNETVESFSFRTCVKPILTSNQFGETDIVYESLTAQDLLVT